MTEQENYRFDVSGFLILRGVLSADELAGANLELDGALAQPQARDRDPFPQLRDHPVLAGYVEALCGPDYRCDTGPTWLVRQIDDRLQGGGEFLDWSRAYFHRNGVRHCQAVTAYWALEEMPAGDGSLALIPASHNGNVETPADVLFGADDLGLLEQPNLQAGDLLLCADRLVRGRQPGQPSRPQRMLAYGFVNALVRPHDGSNLDDAERRPWSRELTPAEQAVLHDPQRRGAPAVVLPDGDTCRLEEGDAPIHHPSIYVRNPNVEIDEKEFYHWDLCGHLVLKEVMDAAWLAAANEALDANQDRVDRQEVDVGGAPSRLGGTHRSMLYDVWNLPRPHGEPFRRMIADPRIVARLNWMMGSGYQATKCEVLCSGYGGMGHALHAGGTTQSETNHYTFRNGRCYCEYINVAWQLRDVTDADGGFCGVPGSHKTVYSMPEGVRTAEDDMDLIRHVGMEAGDVVLFLAGAQTHGAFPWKGAQDRRSVLLQYRSRNLSREYSAAPRPMQTEGTD